MKRIVNKNGTDTSGSLPEIAVMKEISTLKQKDSIVHYYRLPDGYTLEYEVGSSNDTMPIRKDGVTDFFNAYSAMCDEDDMERNEGRIPSWEAKFNIIYLDKELLKEHLNRKYHPYVRRALEVYAESLRNS